MNKHAYISYLKYAIITSCILSIPLSWAMRNENNTHILRIIILLGIIHTIMLFWDKYRRVFKYIMILVTIFLLAGIIPVIINESYKMNDGYITIWGATDFLQFYGSFLTFIGTITLGALAMFKDKNKAIKDAKISASILIKIIQSIDIQLLRMSRNKDNRIILYDKDWRNYLYKLNELDIKYFTDYLEVLIRKFDMIDCINDMLVNNDINGALSIYNRYERIQRWSTQPFSEADVVFNIIKLSSNFDSREAVPWDTKKEIKAQIDNLSDAYFGVIENWIYNRLLRSKSACITSSDIEVELAEWLSSNSDEIKTLIDDPFKTRIYSKMISTISNQLKRKSKRIYYVWGEYHMTPLLLDI